MRLGLVFGALAAVTTAAIAVAWMVFGSIAGNMAVLSNAYLPELQASAEMVAATDEVRDLLLQALVEDNPGGLDRLTRATETTLADLRQNMFGGNEAEGGPMADLVTVVERSLLDLTAARKQALELEQSVALKISEALQLAAAATHTLAEASDSAYFEMVLGGDATIGAVDASLTALIDEDFALYQSTLAASSAMNLLSGLALSRTQTEDASVRSVLADLAAAADTSLGTLLAPLAASERTAALADEVEAAQAQLMQVFAGRGATVRPLAILAVRQEIDVAFAAMLDDIQFDLVIKGEDTKAANKAAISLLMNEQVTALREQAALVAATKSFVSAVLRVALTDTPEATALAADDLGLAAAQLREAMAGANPALQADLTKMLSLADPDSGIVSARADALAAEARALTATQAATGAVGTIAGAVAEGAAAARAYIDDSAATLNRTVATARQRIEVISLLCAVLVLLAPLFIWWMIARPLNRVTLVTERLARGDLSKITEIRQRHGEIGRLAQALHIFRQGALERIQLQADEQRVQQEKQEAERAAEQIKREADQKARDLEAARQEADRAREAEEQAREVEHRAREEAERDARAQEQELIVSELAEGLHRLSNGNLSRTIETPFPGRYDSLRQDYNAAVMSLSGIIERIGQSAEIIDRGSAEITAASLELSVRTENAASTLEEASTALSTITAGVSGAAAGASNAAREAEEINRQTEKSRKIMTDAVEAMREIEGSSTEIGQIVSVIDAIAFQTNLLALNAGVEAARAGEAGAGFAVVAQEVRQLAHRSSEAADQIKALVTVSTSQVQNGVTLLAETSERLDRNLEGISRMSGSMGEIATSSEAQARSLSDVNGSFEALDRDTQCNAAMFEETTAANQSLTEQARQLMAMVSDFAISGAPAEADAAELAPDQGAGAQAA